MADKTLDTSSTDLDDTIYDHRWGFKDTKFVVNPDRSVTVTGDRYALAGQPMPEFLSFAEEILGIKIDTNNIKSEITKKPVDPPNLNEAFVTALSAKFSERQISTDDRERLIRSHGQTTADEVYKVLYEKLERVVDLVFYVEEETDAQTLIELAQEHNVCLVPYGGGTSVSSALMLPKSETRMIVSVDMSRMTKMLWIDKENYRACFQAGIRGSELEAVLEKEGFTCGHEPDSMELSTLGGWIATNASGMKKNKYGNIESVVETMTLITPTGVIEQKEMMPRVSMGIQPQQVAFGSEGNLGLITKAVIRIHKLPEVKSYGSIVFPNFKVGTDYMYDMMQADALPASIRLLDNVQFRFGSALKPAPSAKEKLMGDIQKFFLLKVKKFPPYELCAVTLVMEGTAEEVAYQERVAKKLMKKHGGMWGGEGNGKRGYMLTYAIAYIRDFFADFDVIGETYETTVPWSKIHDVIDVVTTEGERMHKEFGLPGKPYISPRVTQLYRTGVCIYFTHGFAAMGVDHPEEVFAKIEHTLREKIMEAGGSISHHHGIGKIRQSFIKDTMTPASLELIQQMKQAADPNNIFGIRNNVFMDES